MHSLAPLYVIEPGRSFEVSLGSSAVFETASGMLSITRLKINVKVFG